MLPICVRTVLGLRQSAWPMSWSLTWPRPRQRTTSNSAGDNCSSDNRAAEFTRHGVADESLDLVWVPGSFELPSVATKLASSGHYAAVICLGCVIQGETDHYDYVCSQTASGIAQASMETGVPVIFGVLTCGTLEQAMNRAGGKSGNKGTDAALAAIEMVSLLKQLPPN